MWTMGTVLVGAGADFEALDGAEVLVRGSDQEGAEKAAHEVRKAVKALVKSGALGDGPFRVMANGHANKGSKDTGDGPDFVGLQIVFDDTTELPSDLEMRLGRPESHDAAKQELAEGRAVSSKAPAGKNGDEAAPAARSSDDK